MGQLGDYTIDQVAGAGALILGSLGGLLLIIFKSRCSTISCCWGLFKCDRVVPPSDDHEDNQDDTTGNNP